MYWAQNIRCCRNLKIHNNEEQKNLDRLEIKKFNPVLKRVTVHKEINNIRDKKISNDNICRFI
jgi:ribosomal protein L33